MLCISSLPTYTNFEDQIYHLSQAASPFCLSYFSDWVLVFAWAGLDLNPPIYASCLTGMTDTQHHTQLLLVEMDSLELFVQAGIEP
jgi:hypothetical protein